MTLFLQHVVRRRAISPLLVGVLGAAHAGLASPLAAQDAPRTQTVPAMSAPVLPLKHAPQPTTAAITVEDLMTRLYIFADDSLMGRDAGTEGSVKATEYLAREAERMGLLPAGENGTYFQTLPLKKKSVDPMSSFIAGGASLELGKEWAFTARGTLTIDSAPLVFGGILGDTTATLSAEQVAGKLVAYTMPATQTGIGMALEGANLLPAGAKGLVIVVPQPVIGILRYVLSTGAFVDDGEGPGPRYYVMMNAVPKLFAKPIAELEVGAEGATVNSTAVVALEPVAFPARNVVAVLPGSDPVLKHQYVAVGAHSDHVGMAPRSVDHDSVLVFNRIVRPGGAEDQGKMGTPEQFAQVNAELAELRKTRAPRADSIFNGADDDGSGSVAVQEIAEYLSSLTTKPKRSTLFVWHVGEEKGLWGSAYFTEHSTVPRDSIVAQLNMDMVGRGSQTDQTGMTADGKELRGGPDYLQLVGSRRLSTELGDLVERVNGDKQHRFTFDYAMDANGHPMNIYCRSDHYEYAKWGIPVTFFTTGGHSAYHQLTDEPQYIDYPHMQRVTALVSDIALELGNRAERPVVDQPKLDPRGTCKQ
jgi:hypothetical protein